MISLFGIKYVGTTWQYLSSCFSAIAQPIQSVPGWARTLQTTFLLCQLASFCHKETLEGGWEAGGPAKIRPFVPVWLLSNQQVLSNSTSSLQWQLLWVSSLFFFFFPSCFLDSQNQPHQRNLLARQIAHSQRMGDPLGWGPLSEIPGSQNLKPFSPLAQPQGWKLLPTVTFSELPFYFYSPPTPSQTALWLVIWAGFQKA